MNFLTRAQVDSIIDGMTARDLFDAMPSDGAAPEGSQLAGNVFEVAAKRQGHGDGALDRVKVQDATHLAQRLGEVFGTGPKGDKLAK